LTKAILSMLMVSDLFCLAWILLNHKHFKTNCNFTSDWTLFIAMTVSGAIFLILSQVSYWLLACRYWQISYEMEEIIKPLGFIPRKDWHKTIEKGMLYWIVVWTLVCCFLYAVKYRNGGLSE